MRKFHSLFFITLFFSVGILKSQKEKITLVFSYKSQYCSGARPTPEMLAEAERSKPYANKTIILVSDNFKVDSGKTNAKGEIKFKIKKGTYKAYEAWKFYKSGPGGADVVKFDKECLKMEWERQLFTIMKDAKKTRVETSGEIIEQCPWGLPCIRPENIGPIPD